MSFGDQWREAAQRAADFEPEKGNYKVRIVSGFADMSNTGDPKARVVLEILNGDDAGKRFEHFMWMGHEVSRAIHREALLAYGMNEDGIETVEDLDDRIQTLIGTEADVTVSYAKVNGEDRLNVKVFGSKPGDQQRLSDIPTDNGPEQKPAASFAAAAKSDDGPLPF